MKVGDLVVLSARGNKLQRNTAIAHYHGGYGIVCKVGRQVHRLKDNGDIYQLCVTWFKKSGEFYRTRYFDRYELKKKKRLNKS